MRCSAATFTQVVTSSVSWEDHLTCCSAATPRAADWPQPIARTRPHPVPRTRTPARHPRLRRWLPCSACSPGLPAPPRPVTCRSRPASPGSGCRPMTPPSISAQMVLPAYWSPGEAAAYFGSPTVMSRMRGQVATCHRRLNGSATKPAPAAAIARSSLLLAIFRAVSMEGVSRNCRHVTMAAIMEQGHRAAGTAARR